MPRARDPEAPTAVERMRASRARRRARAVELPGDVLDAIDAYILAHAPSEATATVVARMVMQGLAREERRIAKGVSHDRGRKRGARQPPSSP